MIFYFVSFFSILLRLEIERERKSANGKILASICFFIVAASLFSSHHHINRKRERERGREKVLLLLHVTIRICILPSNTNVCDSLSLSSNRERERELVSYFLDDNTRIYDHNITNS